MARFGSLNRARQQAHYNSLSKRRPNRAPILATIRSRPRTNPASKWLQIELAPGQYAIAVFVRTAGQIHWRCTGTDHPSIDWFTRVSHITLIDEWLFNHRLPFSWLSHNPVGSAHKTPTVHAPAEAFPPSKASQESSTNTGTTLNKKVAAPTAGCSSAVSAHLSQTGVTTSLLHSGTTP